VAAKKPVAKKPAKKAAVKPAKKATPIAKKSVAKKPAAKKRVVKKAAVKKTVAKKVAAKKPAAKKAVAKKPIAKKAVVKKAIAKKPAKKIAVKKTAVKKSPAKKIALKKAVKKSVAKKAVKKAVVKKAIKKAVVKKAPTANIIIAPKGPRYAGPDWPLMNLILDAMEDAKAEEIIPINVEGRSSMADGMVIASGRANRHVAAIADQLVEKLKAFGQKDIRVEGLETSDWVLVDAGNIIVHIFRPEVRSFYNLEKLWSEHAPLEGAARE
jgi:ribosome-associated protein